MGWHLNVNLRYRKHTCSSNHGFFLVSETRNSIPSGIQSSRTTQVPNKFQQNSVAITISSRILTSMDFFHKSCPLMQFQLWLWTARFTFDPVYTNLTTLNVRPEENKGTKEKQQEKNTRPLTIMLNPFHHFIHKTNNQWVKNRGYSQEQSTKYSKPFKY